MIRVNLLPVRAARKKENVRRQVSVFFLTVFFAICVLGYLAYSMNRKMAELSDDIEGAKRELAELEVVIKKVNEFKDNLARVEAKMAVIERLQTNRTGSVRIMDALTSLVVAQKMWLTSLSEAGGVMTLVGMAVDNKTIADFMKRLEGSPYVDDVNLVASRQTPMGPDKKFQGFPITSQAVILQPPQ